MPRPYPAYSGSGSDTAFELNALAGTGEYQEAQLELQPDAAGRYALVLGGNSEEGEGV